MKSNRRRVLPKPWHLPTKHSFSHWYCFFLHDQLVETLRSGEAARVFHIDIKGTDQKKFKPLNQLHGADLIDWLRANGYAAEVMLLYYKQVVAALTSDFLHFVHEALQASRKGKLTVAYALLRKPLKENLFFLEWLLARPADFLERFEREDSRRFKLGEESARAEQINIITEAMRATRYSDWLDPEFLYDLRFRKDCPYGLESTWQKANHLLTTFRFLETESTNFNFVFSDAKALQSQWDGLYMLLPLLLFHAVEVIEALIAKFAKRKQDQIDFVPLRTVAGFALWAEQCTTDSKTIRLATKSVQEHFESAGLECPTCHRPFSFGRRNLRHFYEASELACFVCKRRLRLDSRPGAP